MAHMRNAFWCVEADLPMLAIAVRCEIRDEFGPFPNDSYSLRTDTHYGLICRTSVF